MQKILTTALLETLFYKGYNYVLSKTMMVVGQDADTCIILTPVTYTPTLKTLPPGNDKYFKISEEPWQMALGVDETIVLVDLSDLIPYAEII